MTINVAVIGALGQMGRTVCRAILEADELDLVAAVDVRAADGDWSLRDLGIPSDLVLQGSLDVLLEVEAHVAVDFTVADAARDALPWLASNGIHAVVGTTGFTDDDLGVIRAAFEASDANCIIAPNFAISAVLMMRFAEMAAPFFDTAEVLELHHDNKIDAPSGTAMATVDRMASASTDWGVDPTENEVLPGARGGKGPGGIRVHSVRMRGMVAHQEVILGAEGQTITIRQDSYDRTSYMPGVVLAVKRIADKSGLTLGLDDVLDI